MTIVPAILEKSLASIGTRLNSILGAATVVQIDVVDGRFAPNTTWPYAAPDEEVQFAEMAAGERRMPYADDFDIQFDLMVEDALAEAPRFSKLMPAALVVHSSSRNAKEALEALQEKRKGDFPLKLGIALPCDAQTSALAPFESLYDFVQVMGIAKPGFQGEKFDARALALIAALRAARPDLGIQADGGVGRGHLTEVAFAGADRAAEGSAIFGTADPKQALKELYRIPLL